MDTSSVGGMSEEGTGSLVGFGEGARTPARQSVVSYPSSAGGGMGMKGSTPTAARDAKMIDGVTYDPNVVDTTTTTTTDNGRRNFASTSGVEQAERIVREHMDTTSADHMRMRGGHGPADMGKFGFER